MPKSADRRPAYRPLLRHNHTTHSRAIYELATIQARITFRITNPYYIQWQPNEQTIAIRAPQRVDTTSRWRDEQGQTIHTVTHSSDCAKFIKIQGLYVGQMFGAHFHFRPTQAYQDTLLEERAYFDKGIKLRLTKQAARRSLVIPKGAYLGNLYVVTLLLVHMH